MMKHKENGLLNTFSGRKLSLKMEEITNKMREFNYIKLKQNTTNCTKHAANI